MIWPLVGIEPQLPGPDEPGSFGYKRSYYYHEGIDLYCPAETYVQSIEDGIVVNIETFTGYFANPPTPWWNDTHAIMIEGDSGVLGYCEIGVSGELEIGHHIKAGQIIGYVVPVLREDKGNGTSMLHFEQYTKGTRSHVTWYHDEPSKPDSLIDPSRLLFHVLTQRHTAI